MKCKGLHYSALLILCYLISPVMVFAAQLEPYTGNAIRTFKLVDLNGQTHSLPDFSGKVILINFWATWCLPCIKELPELAQLKKQFANQPFDIVALNTGETKYEVAKFNRRYQVGLPILLDTKRKTFNDWGLKLLPTSYLIDQAGHIRYQVLGNPGWDSKQSIDIIKNLIEETGKLDLKQQ